MEIYQILFLPAHFKKEYQRTTLTMKHFRKKRSFNRRITIHILNTEHYHFLQKSHVSSFLNSLMSQDIRDANVIVNTKIFSFLYFFFFYKMRDILSQNMRSRGKIFISIFLHEGEQQNLKQNVIKNSLWDKLLKLIFCYWLFHLFAACIEDLFSCFLFLLQVYLCIFPCFCVFKGGFILYLLLSEETVCLVWICSENKKEKWLGYQDKSYYFNQMRRIFIL